MKRLYLIFAVALLFTATAFGQGNTEKSSNTETVEVKTFGAKLSNKAKKADIAKTIADPLKFDGAVVEIAGVVTRNCQSAGCWAEIKDEETGKTVRATFGDHAFSIPLKSAGMKIRAEGVFVSAVYSKEEVDEITKQRGSEVPNRNADGTLTVITFDATGIELTPAK